MKNYTTFGEPLTQAIAQDIIRRCEVRTGIGHRRSCDLGNVLAAVCEPTVPMPMEQILYLQELRQRIEALSPKWGPLVAQNSLRESRFCNDCGELTSPADCPNPNLPPVRCRACTEKTAR